MNPANPSDGEADLLIDEVRAIRHSICDLFGNDVEKLAEHLRNVEEEFRSRTGRFADLPRQTERELFPDAALAEPDSFISDVPRLRRA